MYFCGKKVMLNTFKNYLLTNNIAIQNEDETTISFKKDDLYYLFIKMTHFISVLYYQISYKLQMTIKIK